MLYNKLQAKNKVFRITLSSLQFWMHNGNYILEYLHNLSIRKTYLTLLRVSSFSRNVIDFENKFQLLPLWESWCWQKLKRKKIFEKYCYWKSFTMNKNILKCWVEYTVINIPLSQNLYFMIFSKRYPIIILFILSKVYE